MNLVSRAGSVSRSNNSRRSYGRRRNKWNTMNTQTNPVYPRPETKYFDFGIGTAAAPIPVLNDATGIQCINQLAQGASSGQRVGAQVSTKSCYYQMLYNLGSTQTPCVIRHILYWDRQYNNQATPNAANLLANTNYVTSPLNLTFRDRFVVLSDDRITLSPNGDMIRIIDGFRTINQLSTYPEGASLPSTGALCLLIVSDRPAGTTAPTIYGSWRTRYMDN